MIYSIEGRLVEKTPMQVVVETGGIAYSLHVPLSTSEHLEEAQGKVKLYTHLAVREDGMELYGFATVEERKAFEILITIPGIGPKVALRVLSGMTSSELRQAVIAQDVSLLTRVPGIGKKLAERILVELKAQIENIPAGHQEIPKKDTEVFADAVEALATLGYRRNQAAAILSGIVKELKGSKVTLEFLIKEALKRI